MSDQETPVIEILKVITGSQAHGLATPASDFDYRGVFVVPTKSMFKIGHTMTETRWIEGKEDDTSWEIGKFLLMATKCNPTVLEVFKAPVQTTSEAGTALQKLFPHVWNSAMVKDAFIGYGLNQRKKFFDNKDQRAPKYAAAYLRVLYNAWELLTKNDFSVDLRDAPIYKKVKNFKEGRYEVGEVIQECWEWETKVLRAYRDNPDKKTNMEPINEFLLEVRERFWNA